ncbi:MAG: hypothetical protein ACR2QH_15235 [Geminicoccaceae bacterium]
MPRNLIAPHGIFIVENKKRSRRRILDPAQALDLGDQPPHVIKDRFLNFQAWDFP